MFLRSASAGLLGLRGLHGQNGALQAPKSALAKLRKKTGYSLSLCKKALEQHEQDVGKAEEWLKVYI
jgi:elongation factor Ts